MQDNHRPLQDKTRHLKSGNRCGHHPTRPRWFSPPPDHKPRPPILRQWIERVRQFFDRPQTIPSLNGAHHARQRQRNPDHKARQMRSERREACCSLLGAIAHYLDLPSLCLSVPQPDGSLLPITMAKLAEAAGLSMRRAERAMRDIIDAGLLGSHQRAELLADGTYRGHAAIRVVPTSFFGLFGLEVQLEHDRQRISEQRRQARDQQQPTRTAAARIKVAVGAAINAITGRDKPPEPTVPETAAAKIDLDRPLSPEAASARQHLKGMKEILSGAGGPQPPTAPRRSATDDQGAADTDRADVDPPRRPRGRDPP